MSKANHTGWVYPNPMHSNHTSRNRSSNLDKNGFPKGGHQPKQLAPFGAVLPFPKPYKQHATKPNRTQPSPRSKPRHMNTMQTHGKHNHTGKLVPLQQLPWGGQASVPIQQKRTYPSAQQNRVVASYAPPDLSANRRRLVWMLLGLLFVLGVQGYWWITHKQTVARLDDLTMRVEHDTKDLTELRTDVSGAMKSLWGTTNELSSTVAELRSPPSRFQDANGLYAVGRFVEAEAAFSAFLKENPISRLADEALFKAGASAALSHNCSIALAHWGDLATRFPASSFNQRVADMKRVCSLPDAKSVAYR